MKREFDFTTDVLVAGGGLSGVCCALAAARAGAKVILVQDRPVLGGNASSEIRMHVVGADCHGARGTPLECETREGGLIEEIRLDLSVQNPQRSPSMFDVLLYDKCRSESNIRLLLNATLTGVLMEGTRIHRASIVQESTETTFHVAARQFVDCTGDGRLGAEAGAACRRGREGQAEFGESLALPEPDECTLGSSLLFTASRRDEATEFHAPSWARHFEATDLNHKRLHLRPGTEANGLEYGFWWLEWGGQLNTISDNEEIRDELLSIVLGVWDHIKNSGLYPGVEYWALDWIGFLPGKRESRRLEGPYVLTQHDVDGAAGHPDAIAYGGWWMDLHPPQGVDAPTQAPCVQHHIDYLFDIPLRSCFSKNISNLWMAGRNISATHVAFASTRVMATCAVIGQGVGTASALAISHEVDPAELVAEPRLMAELQHRLLKEDCFLIGRRNEDPADLARTASVAASSECPESPASAVISGITRAVHGKGGVKPGSSERGTHRWMSDAELPACLTLTWKEVIPASEIRLVFDTGMHRELTFSLSSNANRTILWGQAQPETVRHYRLLAQNAEGRELLLAEVKNNHRRLCVHRLDAPLAINALRVEVLSTHGVPEARICEVRVY